MNVLPNQPMKLTVACGPAAYRRRVGQTRKTTQARAFALVALGLLAPSCDRREALQAGSARWSLTFSDEFDGTSIDETKWNVGNPLDRIINNELQAYVPEAVRVQSGLLQLIANRGSTEYRGSKLPFTSGTVTTHQKFSCSFGRLVVRARLPRGQGLWPAFWLLPESLEWPPEIDLFEVRGQAPAILHQTIHWRDPERGAQFDTAQQIGPDLSVGFHEFRVDWSSDAITWFVDEAETRRVTRRIPSTPMYLNAALAVGGDFPGAPDASTLFPAVLEIDYVRVFQLVPSSPR
jgi:beta-glucanase (GH16 family)